MSTLVLVAALLSCGQPTQDSASSPADKPPSEAATKVDAELSERCGRSIRQITKLIMSGPDSSSISPSEAAIIEVTTAMSIATCEGEGLSTAQEACLLAVEDMQKLSAVAECPAIAERKPSWLILPATRADEAPLRTSDDGDDVSHGDKD